ncbi:hypothetical protein SAMD00023353_0400120 [Rosellinia necatrix]|uniref:Uncharacterized protein n=1 Tax=Rosellinia necatrix TaxID=77044 RepID=A0A1S7UIG3_ROSNE|nr:hypothetical protein SAMD00023353_0400120 [Rosellinia necatrix]
MSGDDDLDSGLLGISLSDSDAEPSDGQATAKKPSQEDRTAQSEADFQEVKRTYHVKVENGEIWKTVRLPLGPRVSKAEAQALLHAVEELYFLRRFPEGLRLVRSVVGDGGAAAGLDGDTLKTLQYYERRCNDRMGGA